MLCFFSWTFWVDWLVMIKLTNNSQKKLSQNDKYVECWEKILKDDFFFSTKDQFCRQRASPSIGLVGCLQFFQKLGFHAWGQVLDQWADFAIDRRRWSYKFFSSGISVPRQSAAIIHYFACIYFCNLLGSGEREGQKESLCKFKKSKCPLDWYR